MAQQLHVVTVGNSHISLKLCESNKNHGDYQAQQNQNSTS